MANTQSSQLIIFGGTGDLALRKLQPALYKLQREGFLNNVCSIIALGRTATSNEEYCDLVKTKMCEFLPAHFWDEQHWLDFSAKLQFVNLDVNTLKDYHRLTDAIHRISPPPLPYTAVFAAIYTVLA
jgi:glucose-6-phosphate 1-dehydrogenase